MAGVRHPRFARAFERRAARAEAAGQAALRRELLAGLDGAVVEVGAGTGLSFPHYPAAVRVLALEPEPYLRGRALAAAGAASARVRVVAAVADQIPARDGAFDAAVVSGVLCSVPDPGRALAELRRVLRPGGELRFYEHVRAAGAFGRVQDAAAPLWSRLHGGCRPNRETLMALEGAGFRVRRWRGFQSPTDWRWSPVGPRILGVALRA